LTPEAQALFASALAFEDQGRTEDALASYGKALVAEPFFDDAFHNRGLLLARMGRLADAERSHREYLAACPSAIRARSDLADILLAEGKYEDALEQLDQVLALAPRIPALVGKGLALASLGRFDAARSSFAQAAATDSTALQQHVRRIAPGAPLDVILCPENIYLWRRYVAQGECDWRGWDDYLAVFRRAATDPGIPLDPSAAFMAFHLPLSARERLEIARKVAHRMESAAPPISPKARGGRAKLRIGVLSPDFRDHVNAHLLLPFFELLDRKRFELFACPLTPDDGSAAGRTLRAAADRIIELHALTDEAATAAILAHEIDILIDAGGHTTGGRFGITARRPAPLQVSYLGFAGSVGSSRVDYAIVDGAVAPPGTLHEWAEALAILPHTYYLYDFRSQPPAVPVSRSEYGLPDQTFVYCAFHKAEKITPDAFDCWMRILLRVPASVLWLPALPAARTNLRAAAQARGVEPERLHFAPFDTRERYLARQLLGDLLLDCFHHSAMTTACDALGAGLPVLTVEGTSMASRAGPGMVRAAGLPELVARNPLEFEELAVRLALERDRLSALKGKLVSGRRSAPLFDTPGRIRAIESVLEHMHRRAVEGGAPATFEVAPA
jgi:predicted O-linked N-acetylglucosamine transferase (SPINDLY family)